MSIEPRSEPDLVGIFVQWRMGLRCKFVCLFVCFRLRTWSQGQGGTGSSLEILRHGHGAGIFGGSAQPTLCVVNSDGFPADNLSKRVSVVLFEENTMAWVGARITN